MKNPHFARKLDTMTDYHPLISRAVEGLERNTGEARRALYERARTALVTQLRAVEPPLSESDITRERLALEDAIRKVEAEAARKSRTELRQARRGAAAAARAARRAAPERTAFRRGRAREETAAEAPAPRRAAERARAAARRASRNRSASKASRASATSSARCTILARPPPRRRNRRATPATPMTTTTPEDVDDYRFRHAIRRGRYAMTRHYDSRAAERRRIRRRGRAPASPHAAAASAADRRRRPSAAAALLSRADPAHCGADHSRRPCGDRIVAVAARSADFISSLTQIGAETAEPAATRSGRAAEIFRARAAGAERRAGRRRRHAGRASGAGGGAARRPLRRGFEQSARQALCRFGDLAHRDGFARSGASAGTGGARRRHHSGTQDHA